MNDEEGLIAEAEIGDEARKFVESELGKTLLGMAHQEILMAQEALEKIDPSEIEKIRELQNQAKIARHFEQWLGELITKGANAIAIWRQQNG
jgi:hypothetical protein